MKEIEEFNIGIKPKTTQHPITGENDQIVFNWFMYANDPTQSPAKTYKQMILFQMFVIQQSMLLLIGESGMSETLHKDVPKIKLTDKQRKLLLKKMSTLNNMLQTNLLQSPDVIIKKPNKINLHENN